jgi:hypothetical protein
MIRDKLIKFYFYFSVAEAMQLLPLRGSHFDVNSGDSSLDSVVAMARRRGFVAAIFLADSFNKAQFAKPQTEEETRTTAKGSAGATECCQQIQIEYDVVKESHDGSGMGSNYVCCGHVDTSEKCCIFNLVPYFD